MSDLEQGPGDYVSRKESNVAKVVGIGCLVLVTLAILGFGGCYWLGSWALSKTVLQQCDQIEAAARSRTDHDQIAAKLIQIRGLADAGKLNIFAKTAWTMTVPSLIRDNKLDDAEVEQLDALLGQLIANRGALSAEDVEVNRRRR